MMRRTALRTGVGVLAGLAVAIGFGLGKPEKAAPPAVRTASRGDLQVRYRTPWHATAIAPSVPGLRLARPLALQTSSGLTLVAGVADVATPSLLPAALSARVPVAARVKLAGGVGARYADLTVRSGAAHMALVALPRARDVVFVACIAGRPLTTADRTACDGVTSSLRVSGARPVGLAPRPEFARAADAALSRFAATFAKDTARVEAAKSIQAQSDGLGTLRNDCRTASSSFRSAPAGPQEAQAVAVIAGDLDDACSIFKQLADTAGGDKRNAYADARRDAADAQAALQRDLLKLRALGYSVVAPT